MSSKPKPRLQDVFARPGGAPARGTPIEDLPRHVTPTAPTPPSKSGGGIKASTVGTTLYLLPHESKRLKRLALDLDLSVHELLLRGIDRILEEHAQAPIERYRS
jgi:hypothetical protein